MGDMKKMEIDTKKIGSGEHQLLNKSSAVDISSDIVKNAGFEQGEVIAINIISPKTIVVTKEYDEWTADQIKESMKL